MAVDYQAASLEMRAILIFLNGCRPCAETTWHDITVSPDSGISVSDYAKIDALLSGKPFQNPIAAAGEIPEESRPISIVRCGVTAVIEGQQTTDLGQDAQLARIVAFSTGCLELFEPSDKE